MHWQHFKCWLETLPKWQGIAVAVLFFFGLVVMFRGLVYGWVMNRCQDAREDKINQLQKDGKGTHFIIDAQMAASLSKPVWIYAGLWKWLAKRAGKWDRRKTRSKGGIVKPPFP